MSSEDVFTTHFACRLTMDGVTTRREAETSHYGIKLLRIDPERAVG